MENGVVVETVDLTKVYNGLVAVDHLNFSVREGEIFGFLGPNGAGKTTTLLMLLGLTEPTSGYARVMGFDPVREPIKVKRVVGHLQENMGFYRDLDAWQMLFFIAELNGIDREDAEERIEKALKTVNLLDQSRKKINTYSRGMRQRLGIAEILVKDPKIAFLDEPTIGLDPDATNRMNELIEELAKDKRMTIILSSHLLHQAQKICDRFGIMIEGKMVAVGTMEQLAGERFDIGKKEYTLEEIYMKYFKGE
jgi:ABC-2 type transport system ATP-binding protein